MPKPILIILLFFTSTFAQADWLHKLVGYDCNATTNTLILSFMGAYNEEGEAMIQNKSSTQWDPWDFIVSMKNDNHIGELRTIEAECRLDGVTYEISIGPTPGNMNIQGRCGAHMSAWAEVRQGSNIILPRHEFEPDCHDLQSPVTTEVIINANSGNPIIKTQSQNDFVE